MKMKIFVICLFTANVAFSQKIQEIKLNCPDSLGFITNQGNTRDCTFFLYEGDEHPTFYFVENFSHENFADLIYKSNYELIKRVKIVTNDYVAKPHDFIYTYNSKNALLFYYILKDWKEEKMLQP